MNEHETSEQLIARLRTLPDTYVYADSVDGVPATVPLQPGVAHISREDLTRLLTQAEARAKAEGERDRLCNYFDQWEQELTKRQQAEAALATANEARAKAEGERDSWKQVVNLAQAKLRESNQAIARGIRIDLDVLTIVKTLEDKLAVTRRELAEQKRWIGLLEKGEAELKRQLDDERTSLADARQHWEHAEQERERLGNRNVALERGLIAANAARAKAEGERAFYKSRHDEGHTALDEIGIVNGVADTDYGLATRISILADTRQRAIDVLQESYGNAMVEQLRQRTHAERAEADLGIARQELADLRQEKQEQWDEYQRVGDTIAEANETLYGGELDGDESEECLLTRTVKHIATDLGTLRAEFGGVVRALALARAEAMWECKHHHCLDANCQMCQARNAADAALVSPLAKAVLKEGGAT